jgi:mannose-6-phosphate isomerase
MLRSLPFVSQKIWGYENWIVSTHPAGQSRVIDAAQSATQHDAQNNAAQNNALRDALGGTLGSSYPLLIKVIQANQTLSVQVHPSDDYARAYESASGKTECWFVLDAAPDSKLVVGLKNCTQEDVRSAIAQNCFEQYLHFEPVSAGDFIYIPAGIVHAIGSGIRLLEVQQSSDITYRLYDWGRERELHIQKALDVMRFETSRVIHNFAGNFSCPYFELSRINIHQKRELIFTAGSVLFVLYGSGSAMSNDEPGFSSIALNAEDTFLFTTKQTVTVQGNVSLMHVLPPLT